MKNLQAVSHQPKDFFEEFGLEITSGDVTVGNRYPIYGMITKFISDLPGAVIVELNFGILAHMNINERSAIETVRERMFESGIFVCTIVAKEPRVEVMCQTVIFGQRPRLDA